MNSHRPPLSELTERDQKLQALKLTVNHLCHEFKNLLVPQLGYATLIREEAGPDSGVAPFAQKLQDAARKADEYLEAVLNAVRPQRRFRPRDADVAELARQSIAQWKARAPENIELSVELSSCRSKFDELQWQNVFVHLLTNCQEAMPSGGKIRVTLEPERELSNPGESLGLNGAQVFRLQVIDNGSGMTEEVRNRCYEPFFSTRPKNLHYGIGLTLAHSVVLLHGGQIVVDSELEKGTTVTIWLPGES